MTHYPKLNGRAGKIEVIYNLLFSYVVSLTYEGISGEGRCLRRKIGR